MKFLHYIVFSFKTLLDHKLRSFLTTLGIIFGVGAVIVMTAIGEGAKKEALAQIKELGIDNLYIRDAREIRKGAFEKGLLVTDGLSVADCDHLKQVISPRFSSMIKEKNLFCQSEMAKMESKVYGVEAAFKDIQGIGVLHGRWFTPVEIRSGVNVCVLTESSSKLFFGRINSVGQFLRVNNDVFAVMGVVNDKSNYANAVYLSLHAPVLHEQLGGMEPFVTELILQVVDVTSIRNYAGWVQESLQRRHNGVEDFVITIPDELLRQQEKTQNLFNSIMILITAVSLLVGGIGIMNIMLASVLERTKEIGIRRGMGATKKDIQHQFLAESVVLTSTGGFIGVIIGVLLTFVVELSTGWDTEVPFSAILVSIGFSVVIGVIFGFYPAKNASELNIIDALRYE